MSLPVPNLDDLTFQQIVDHARKLIPFYCPEWTDHNVSDPGITMIELFASMSEMLLYRVNQVPEKVYTSFLNMLGIRMHEARAAQALMTFYLSSGNLPEPVHIPAGTEVATVRTETDQAIVFTTEEGLTIRPPSLRAIYNYSVAASQGGGNPWIQFELEDLALGRQIPVFPPSLASGDMFCLALAEDHSQHVLALRFTISSVSGSGVNPDRPPIEWVVWSEQANAYIACEKELDTTRGFSQNGEVLLYLPNMSPLMVEGRQVYLLCCRLTAEQGTTSNRYLHPPTLSKAAEVEARGGMAPARQAVVVANEFLGESDGSAGQSFSLRNSSLLERRPEREFLLVQRPGPEPAETWREVRDFADATPDAQVYTLDSRSGVLTLGPHLPQPEGGVYRYGATPPRGSRLVLSQYRYGGGLKGNVPRGAIRVLKSSIPYIARVTNRSAAVGGLDAQSPQEARLLAPRQLRDRTRAVTASDYEELACEVRGVAASHCYGPGPQPGGASDLRPGQVALAVLPTLADSGAERRAEPIALPLMQPGRELREAVQSELGKRSVLGVSLQVRPPTFVQVRVAALLRLRGQLSAGQREATRRMADEALYAYLNPYIGGPEGRGWPFGRDLYSAEIFSLLLRRVPELEFIERLELRVGEQAEQAATARVSLPHDGLVCSGLHTIEIG